MLRAGTRTCIHLKSVRQVYSCVVDSTDALHLLHMRGMKNDEQQFTIIYSYKAASK